MTTLPSKRWLIAPLALLAACAAPDLSRRAPELVVEGNEQSYLAFEQAAQACGYVAFRRFPGARVGAVSVGPHYDLYAVQTRTALCATGWVWDHPETGLIVSGH